MKARNVVVGLLLTIVAASSSAGFLDKIAEEVVKPVDEATKSVGKAIKKIKIDKEVERVMETDSVHKIVLCPEGPPCSKEPGL